MFTEFEACTYATDLLKAAGFEHRHTSFKSEAAYYGMPGYRAVIRVAAHRYNGQEYGLADVICCITITPEVAKKMGEVRLLALVSQNIGFYILRNAGVVALTAKQRARLNHARKSTLSSSEHLGRFKGAPGASGTFGATVPSTTESAIP